MRISKEDLQSSRRQREVERWMVPGGMSWANRSITEETNGPGGRTAIARVGTTA